MNPNKLLLIALINACNILCAGDLFHFRLDGLSIWIVDNSCKIYSFPYTELYYHAGNYTQLYNIFLNSRKDVLFWNPITSVFCNL